MLSLTVYMCIHARGTFSPLRLGHYDATLMQVGVVECTNDYRSHARGMGCIRRRWYTVLTSGEHIALARSAKGVVCEALELGFHAAAARRDGLLCCKKRFLRP